MKAAVARRYGPPEVVQVSEVARPTPGPMQVLIKVAATTVNRTDTGFRSGLPHFVRLVSGVRHLRHPILGCEYAGTVVEVGSDVTQFAVGDEVTGFNDWVFGGHAEYVVAKADGALVTKPNSLDITTSAALLEGGHYALNYVKAAKVGAGCRVLVNGGTGAIGSAGVQIMSARGAQVTATARTEDLALVKSLGAQRAISYEDDDFTRLDDQFDVVFDAVGKSTFAACRHLLALRGLYVSTELGPKGQNPLLAVATRFGKQRVMFPIPKATQEDAQYLKSLAEAGAFVPLMDREYSLDDMVEAHRYVESGQKKGSVAIILR